LAKFCPPSTRGGKLAPETAVKLDTTETRGTDEEFIV